MSGYIIPSQGGNQQTYEAVMRGTSDFATFDPNALTGNHVLWAVYDGGCFRTFNTRGGAVNRFGTRSEAKLYFLDSGKWHLAACKTSYPKEYCDGCHNPIDKDEKRAGASSWERPLWRWELRRTPGGKIIYPLDLRCLCGKGTCR